MKKVAQLLIGVAAVLTLVAIISRLSLKPVGGIEARAIIGFSALLLLFAIALEGSK